MDSLLTARVLCATFLTSGWSEGSLKKEKECKQRKESKTRKERKKNSNYDHVVCVFNTYLFKIAYVLITYECTDNIRMS